MPVCGWELKDKYDTPKGQWWGRDNFNGLGLKERHAAGSKEAPPLRVAQENSFP